MKLNKKSRSLGNAGRTDGFRGTIIHASLRPKQNNQRKRISPISSNDTSSTVSIQRLKRSSLVLPSSASIPKHHSSAAKSIFNDTYQNEKSFTNASQKITKIASSWDTVQNNHRQKEKKQFKCSPKNVLTMLIIVLILATVIAAIITAAVLLTTQKRSASNTKEAHLRWNPIGITVAGITNVSGNGSDKLSLPLGVAVDYNHTLYVTDYQNHRVQRYLRNELVGTTVASSADGFIYPNGIQIDNNRNLYISDVGTGRVTFKQQFTSSSTVLMSGLCSPYGLSREDATGNLYVAESCNHLISYYNFQTSTSTIVTVTNGFGTNNTQLFSPTDVYFDKVSQSMIIVNSAASNIVRWKLGETSWTLVAGNANGSAGSTSTQLSQPVGALLDPMGNLYVVDRFNARVQLFMAGQSSVTTIAGVSGTPGANATQLNIPWFATLDFQLNLYVADAWNHRVQKFLRY